MSIRTTTPLDETLAEDLATLDRAGLRRTLHRFARRRGAVVEVDGRLAVDFSSNDYLGLASDPRIASAIAAALREEGAGAAAARLITGNHPLHEALEREAAALKHAECALLFGSGYLANSGSVAALASRRDAIYADALNHASLIDACRLSRADVHVVPHNDVDALRALLRDGARYRRRLIVADGVFSMDGDVFPLHDVVPLAREYEAAIYLDDAHASGVIGATGAGTAEYLDVVGEVDVTMGTLGKAFGTAGAFVAGSATLRDYLLNRARTFVFTTATPPALAAGALEAIRIAREESWRRERIFQHAARVADGLAGLGYPLPDGAPGHILPVTIGDTERTMTVGKAMREAGFLVGAVRPPTVPMGGSRLRLTLTAAHTEEQIEAMLAALARVLPPPPSRAS